MQTLLCWSTVAEHCSCSSQKIRAVTKSCQRAANPYNCLFFMLWFWTAASWVSPVRAVLPCCPSASTPVQAGPGRCHCWAHPQVIHIRFQGALPHRTSVTWHKHTSGVHQQAPMPWATSWHHSKTHGAHRRLLVLGSAYQWEVGRLSSPTLWVHTSPLRQDWGVISPRLYFMLNILICCPKVLWAGTWQSISKLK